MTKRRFRAAAVQTLARLGDFDYNIALATQYVEDAVRQGAELDRVPGMHGHRLSVQFA